ncbi:MAG: carbon-nitrogen hydrolase family protein [Desulfobacteraceae bacterium]|nr:carbon-nitrogen hydrolase family protein [Desulfobacteraceae bacterium]
MNQNNDFISPDTLKIGIAQIAPVWLDRERTTQKIISFIRRAADEACKLVVFGEALLPGYPFWVERTDGARFNDPVQKEIHAHYMKNAVRIEAGHLSTICETAAEKQIAVIMGCIEIPMDRGGHSLYCTLVYIDAEGRIQTTHRKLMPTYEERLTWSPGDGHGLRVNSLGDFTVGGLNCWENWMPLARTALYAQGEDLHVALWPGNVRNTEDITRFIAMESRSFVISAGGLMRNSDIPEHTPHVEKIRGNTSESELVADGGSCIAGPDGHWVVPPVAGEETLITAVIDHKLVRMERQNFDPAGHYARPDVIRMTVDRTRQNILRIKD